MLNTFILMLALASNPAEAKKQHKHDARPKATSSAHVTKRTSAPTAHGVKHHEHHHHAIYVWAWKWSIGYYDVHGHWIRGTWVWTRR